MTTAQSAIDLSDDIGVSSTAIYNYWKEFDLETLRGTLDQKGLSIVESQESSLKSRKQLAEKTKEFRKELGPEIFKQIAPLLKLYQEEVDALTNRAKLGESSFLDIFKKLYEAPDPAPAIATGIEIASKTADLEAQSTKLAAELAEFKAESNELKNQDITIRKLEEKIRILEADLSEKDAHIEAAEAAAALELEARHRDETRQREEQLAGELSRAEAALEAMRRMHQATQTQLFSMQEKGEETAVATRSEAEYAASEIQRAEERMNELTMERDSLLEQLEESQKDATENLEEGMGYDNDDIAIPGGLDAGSIGQKHASSFARNPRKTTSTSTSMTSTNDAAARIQIASLREDLKTQRELVHRLQAELSSYEQRKESDRTTTENRIAHLHASLEATEAHASALEAELSGRPTRKDLEDARQQIRVLNALVHNTVYDDDDDDDISDHAEINDINNNKGDKDEEKKKKKKMVIGSLENALLTKNRHLEHKLTMARLEVVESKQAASTAAHQLMDTEAELEKQKQLVAKLEEDLIAAEHAVQSRHAVKNNDGNDSSLSATGVPTSLLPLLPATTTTTASPTSSAAAAVAGQHQLNSEQTMLSVLSAQRDRLRDRVQELERHLDTAQHALSKASLDLDAARADNVALVERLRYVQTYGGGGSSSSSSLLGNSLAKNLSSQTAGGGLDLETGSTVVKRYMKDYENQVNPLSDFRAKEREARQRQMPLQDRAAYAIGSALVGGSRMTKSAIVIYAMFLHVVAFVVLAGYSHRHTDKIEALEEMCAQMMRMNETTALGSATTDPVMGGLG